MNPVSNRRRHERIKFGGKVSVFWTGNTGTLTQTQVAGINVSTYGMLVESDIALPLDARVSVTVEEFGFSGRATVVRCSQFSGKHRVGLLFDKVIPFYIDVRRANEEARGSVGAVNRSAPVEARPRG